MNGGTPPTHNDLVIKGPLPCIQCGYDLEKRSVASVCPECGKPAALSRESLWLDGPETIHRLRNGVRWMLIASLIGPAIAIVLLILSMFDFASGRAEEGLAACAGICLSTGPFLAWLGVSQIAAGRPGREQSDVHLRVAARCLAAVFAFAYAFTVSIPVFRTMGIYVLSSERWLLTSMVTAGGLWCFRNMVLLALIRGLARASNMPRIATATPFLQFWSAVLAALGLFTAVVVFGGPFGRPNWIILAPYFIGLALLGAWVLVWPIFLDRFAFGLKRMLKEIQVRGLPSIVLGAGAPEPATPPTQ